MTKQEKLKVIQEKMLNIDLPISNSVFDFCKSKWFVEPFLPQELVDEITVFDKVMIGDIIDFINKPNRDWVNDNVINLLYHYRSPRKPIEDQNEDCIDFVYSLIN